MACTCAVHKSLFSANGVFSLGVVLLSRPASVVAQGCKGNWSWTTSKYKTRLTNERMLGDGYGGHVHLPKIFNLGNCNCNVCKYALKFKKGCKQIAENCRGGSPRLPCTPLGGGPSTPLHEHPGCIWFLRTHSNQNRREVKRLEKHQGSLVLKWKEKTEVWGKYSEHIINNNYINANLTMSSVGGTNRYSSCAEVCKRNSGSATIKTALLLVVMDSLSLRATSRYWLTVIKRKTSCIVSNNTTVNV